MIARRIAGALLLSAALVCSAAAIAGAQFRAPRTKKFPTQITADMFVQMNTSSPGTVLTPTILAAGTIDTPLCNFSGGCNWGTTTAKLAVAGPVAACAPSPTVQIRGGSLYSAATLYNSIEVPAADSFDVVTWGSAYSGKLSTNGTVAGCFTAPGADISNHMDFVSLYDTPGNYAVMQGESNGTGCVAPAVAMEVGQPTTWSSCINLTAGAAYYFSMNFNEVAGTTDLWVWLPSGKQVGHVSLPAPATGNTMQKIELGNNETGTTATPVYFQNVVYDNSGANPLY